MTAYADHPEPEDAMAGDLSHLEPDDRHAPSTPLGAVIINWRTLSADRAPAVWDALRGWVEWFTVEYGIPESVIPACWWKHGRLVQELSALHTAHNVSFHRTDSGLGLIGWHERLNAALPRLRAAYPGSCSRGHDPIKSRTWLDEGIDENEWAAWTSQAHAD